MMLYSVVFGSQLDLHSGGIDLQFPHHENEIAQCEAYYDRPGWCRTFLHVGHLQIKGFKMSKSEKNFITIKDFLKTYTPRQLRLLCLSCHYTKAIEYTEERMREIQSMEQRLQKVLSTTRPTVWKDIISHPTSEILDYTAKLHTMKECYETHLLNDFDTGPALKVLLDAVHELHLWKEKHPEDYPLVHGWTAEFIDSALLDLGVDFSSQQVTMKKKEEKPV
jgi:cysteinyl-tRNA synthetase